MMMRNILNHLAYIPKRLVALFSIAALILVPLQGASADQVKIESQLNIANVTAGDTQYKDSVSAKVDDVLKLELWYHNRELPDSGKVANNLRVKINVPNQVGKNQTFTSTVSSDNSNTVVDTAHATLSLDSAKVEYIPGSAKWRHNIGTNQNVNYVTQSISDAVVTSGNGMVLENLKPCFNFEATVTILVRVKAPAVSIVKKVRHVGEQNWVVDTNAKVGDELEYLINVKNEGNTTLNNVIVGDNLPGPMQFEPNTTMVKNANHPNGELAQSNNLISGGINVGHYGPGANVIVSFKVKVTNKNLKCGENKVVNVGVTRPENMHEFYNTATVHVTKVCKPPHKPPKTPPRETVVTPPKNLVSTGAGDAAAAGMLGSGGLGVAIRGYIRSRKRLAKALLNK